GAISLTGDPRRWAVEPGLPSVVHVLDPYHGIERGWEPAETSLAMIDETIQLEGPHTIAAFILEPVTGTNGILVPPDGYLEGLRKLCDKYGILMIADEVMSGLAGQVSGSRLITGRLFLTYFVWLRDLLRVIFLWALSVCANISLGTSTTRYSMADLLTIVTRWDARPRWRLFAFMRKII